VRVRVIVVDDHQIVRAGVRSALAADARFTALDQAASGAEALRCVHERPPDLALVDLRLPDMSGEELVRALVRERPGLDVIVLTTYLSETLVRGALDAGAVAYVTKAAGLDALMDAVDRVVAGRAAEADEGPQIVEQLRGVIDERLGVARPTERQAEVLELIAEGCSYEEISEELAIAPATVSFHVTRLKGKFEARSTAELIAKAVRLGYVAQRA
jgi:DNA-binding NarL/FixJ family response regulator